MILRPALLILAGLVFPVLCSAQTTPWIRLGVNAIPAYIRADPVPHGGALGELRLLQPVIMAHGGALADRLRLTATLNLEGLTLPDGELALGDWGEGFVDRRHPHTYVHEVMLSFQESLGPAAVSLSAGKGFAPFGTDDPMSRPVLRYPVNHHFAQILERAVGILAVRGGPILLEGALFNGDEPERPSQFPLISRFGDSWSARVTVLAPKNVEIQGSHALVHSPEHRPDPGFGTDQSKWSLSARWSGPVKDWPVYGLIEWARTSEAEGFFVFDSFLAEGAWTGGRSRLHYRFERTERPEEQRTSSPFRSFRPHLENSILGTTRWTIHTAGYGVQLQPAAGVGVFPLVELSYGRMADVGGGVFDVQSFYGQTSFVSITLGARLTVGAPLHRMGRYGVAQDTAESPMRRHHVHHDL